MRFALPCFPAEFEIPNEWWIESGMQGFEVNGTAFRSLDDAVQVPLQNIEPPFRLVTYPKDWRGFDRSRLVSVLNGIATGATIDPVPVSAIALTEYPRSPFEYRVRNGYHRFYASIAAGFEYLPVEIL